MASYDEDPVQQPWLDLETRLLTYPVLNKFGLLCFQRALYDGLPSCVHGRVTAAEEK